MPRSLTRLGTLALVAYASANVTGAELPALSAGETKLVWAGDAQNGYRPLITSGGVVADAHAAGAVQLVVGEGAAHSVEFYCNDLQSVPNGVIARGTVQSASGTRIEIVDRWAVDSNNTFLLQREVTCRSVGEETGYGSAVAFNIPQAKRLDEVEVFIPGIWYATAAHTPRSGLIHDLGQRDFILREDRMPLPLVSVRDRQTGLTLTMEHRQPDGATIPEDDNLRRVVDERMRFGSLGLRRGEDGLSVVFCFPGSEGEQTGIFGYRPDLRTVERFHPLKVDATQRYTLAFRLSPFPDFRSQMREVWRGAYASAKPETVTSDVAKVYDASIHVLNHYAFSRDEAHGFPFSARLPGGEVEDRSLQMGFVGQQLPCASYLIDEGVRTKRPDLVEKGEKIIDFWVKNSFNEKGVPRTWFDVDPQRRWRQYNTFLRVVTDGTSGLLRAWQIERTAGRAKPHWLAFARRVGDWLLKIQNEDGSFFREWRFDGTPATQSKTSTLHPVRLLVDLSCITGEMKYRDAALRAAEFALRENESGAVYVGGTPDNPDVIDKEAGWMAMDSYLALYDVTRDKRWLDAATDAATFTETWIYGWHVPLPLGKENVGVPRVKTFVGTNLIATGHSGADTFLSFASFSYLRLWIYTGDEHWLQIARLLQHNSAQFVDVNGSLGYAQPGLSVEAFSMAVNRGHSVKAWLPWLTSSVLEPMARMRETFGTIDVNDVTTLPVGERSEMNDRFAEKRGYTPSR